MSDNEYYLQMVCYSHHKYRYVLLEGYNSQSPSSWWPQPQSKLSQDHIDTMGIPRSGILVVILTITVSVFNFEGLNFHGWREHNNSEGLYFSG